MKKAIIFDLSDVYLKGIFGVESEIGRLTGGKVSNKDLYNDITFKLFEGKISESEYWKQVIRRHKWQVDSEILKRCIRNHMVEIDGMRNLIENIKKNNNFKLGLLSVHVKEWIVHCESQFRFHFLFDSVAYSYEIGICKPEKKAYEDILGKLSVEPNECYFIDDSLENILAAKVLGIHAIHFKNLKQLKRALKKEGVVITK